MTDVLNFYAYEISMRMEEQGLIGIYHLYLHLPGLVPNKDRLFTA